MNANSLKGVFVPLATAFNNSGAVDVSTMRKLTKFVVDNGVRGVMPAGSTGEFFGLNKKDRKILLEAVLSEAQGKIPVYAGTGAVTTREVIELTKQAEEIGADGVLILTPFYIMPSQEDLYEHYVRIANNTSLPVIVYSNPGRTGGVCPAPETVLKLSRIENIVGLKDSSGNLALTAEYIRQTEDGDFCVLMGQDKLFFAGLMHGCTALVAATANVAPKLVVELYDAYVNKSFERCLHLQKKVTLLRDGFECLPFPVAAKALIKMVGIDVGPPRAPLGLGRELSSEELKKLKKIIEEVS